MARYEAVRSSLNRGARPGLVRPGSNVPFVPSAVILVRTEVVDGHRLFDPELRGGEDVDLEWRLADAGWDVRYEPESVVAHDGAATVGAFLGRRYVYGTSAGPLALRHGEAMAPVQTSGWSVAVWLLSLLRRPGSAMAAQAASIMVLAHRLRGLVRDPVAVAAKIAGGGTARAAVPALAGIARVWSPLLVIGLLFRRTRRLAALALLVPALHDHGEEPGSLDAARYVGAPRRGRSGLRRRGLGRLPPGAHGRAPAAPGGLAFADLVVGGPPRRPRPGTDGPAVSSPDPGGTRARADPSAVAAGSPHLAAVTHVDGHVTLDSERLAQHTPSGVEEPLAARPPPSG